MATLIKDIHGGTVLLTKTHIKESTGEVIPGEKWQMSFVHLRHRLGYTPSVSDPRHTSLGWYVDIELLNSPWPRTGEATVHHGARKLGCRHFTKANYNKIMQAAGLPKVK